MNLSELDTPTLLVDLDVLESNIRAMAKIAADGGKSLRPHTKTHKTPEIARMQLAYGAHGLTVAKLGEAEALADAGIEEIFVANEIVGARKIERLLRLVDRTQITVGIDSVDAAGAIAAAAFARGVTVKVTVEVDTGLGRAGARSDAEVLTIARFAAGIPGLDLIGVFTHEGHLYRTRDRAATASHAADQMRRIAEMCRRDGLPCSVVSMGSTPGAPLLAREPGVTELRPGVYVFNDRTQLRLGAARETCALTVLATVTSVRMDGRIILDAGTKSLASDCNFDDKTFGEIVDYSGLRFVGASEEHGHLQYDGAPPVGVGDRVRILPNHACTCVNMHDNMTAVRGETVEAVWKITGRGRIQ